MPRFSFNPFAPDKKYYKRTFFQCAEQFAHMMVGDSERLGVLDCVPLLLPIVTNWAACHYDVDETNILRKINRFFEVIKWFLFLLIILPSLPFIFIYNKIYLAIGKPIRESIENLELLPFIPLVECCLYHLETPSQPITYDVINNLTNRDKSLVLFENGSLYYLVKSSKQLKQIQAMGQEDDFDDICSYMKDIMAVNGKHLLCSISPNYIDIQLLVVIERVIGFTTIEYRFNKGTTNQTYAHNHGIIKDVRPFLKTYYDQDACHIQIKNLHQQIAYYKFEPVQICLDALNENGEKTYRFVLGLIPSFQHRPHYFLVPSEENAAAINALLDDLPYSRTRSLEPRNTNQMSGFDFLNLALKEKDIFKERMRAIQRGLRVYPPLFLLNSLSEESRPQSGAMLDIYEQHIAGYADNHPTPAESKEIRALLNDSLWARSPKPLPKDLNTFRATQPPSDLAMQKFLLCVARGEQAKAEETLQCANPSPWLVTPGNFTDYSDRNFEDCTAYQYAYWAKDAHMCRMLEKYMDEPAKAFLLEKINTIETTGLSYHQHGTLQPPSPHFDFTPLKQALKAYVDGHDGWVRSKQWDAMCAAWLAVADAQHDVPAHVAQEYCRPDRSFYPCPQFNESRLPRVLEHNCYRGAKT